jgi:putative redox protein
MVERTMAQAAVTAISVDLQDGMTFRAVGEDGIAVLTDSDTTHGGAGAGLRPMELLLVALGSCTGMDVVSILRKKRQHVTGYRIEVVGARATDHPHVFTSITLRHIVHGSDVTADAVRRAIELSEQKYCPAYAMLSKAAPISTSFEILPSSPMD